MHKLAEVIKEVDKTHPGLGNLVAMCLLAIKAKKFLLVVAPRGCGKSRATEIAAQLSGNFIVPDGVSRADLGKMENVLNNFNGVFLIDDLSKAQTYYAMIHITSCLAELCYSHRLEIYLKGSECSIHNFNAAVIANIQPVLLRHIVKSSLWESSMMDKSIRYYHLRRPTIPNPEPIELNFSWGIDYGLVKPVNRKSKLFSQLCRVCECQFGVARVVEHTSHLLTASAAIDGRQEVTKTDYNLLFKLLAPLGVERLVYDKKELEARRYLNSDALSLITEFITHGNFTLRHLARDYNLSESRCREIMTTVQKDWVIIAKNPTTYAPSEDLLSDLKGVGLV